LGFKSETVILVSVWLLLDDPNLSRVLTPSGSVFFGQPFAFLFDFYVSML